MRQHFKFARQHLEPVRQHFKSVIQRLEPPAKQRLKSVIQRFKPVGQRFKSARQRLGPAKQRLKSGVQRLKPVGQHFKSARQRLGPAKQHLKSGVQRLKPVGRHFKSASQRLEPLGQHLRSAVQRLEPVGQHLRSALQRLERFAVEHFSIESRQIIRSAYFLGLFGIVGTMIVAFVHNGTKTRIAANEKAALLDTLHNIIPDDLYDNDIVNDTVEVTHEALGNDQPRTIYLAYKEGKPVGAILTVTAPRGYNGPINLLVGVSNNLTLFGVRVTTHRETPGLGDKIELRQSSWIKEFDGRSIGDPPENRWAVKRDGGTFDQFTGATITPRAIVEAVRQALLYFAEHKEDFLSHSPAQASSTHE